MLFLVWLFAVLIDDVSPEVADRITWERELTKNRYCVTDARHATGSNEKSEEKSDICRHLHRMNDTLLQFQQLHFSDFHILRVFLFNIVLIFC